jgi:putative PIN family toxin of toxin-antitoxin system
VRVVFDTNIFVSALVLAGSHAEEALTRVLEGTDRLILSKPILDELLGVLARKFSRDREELARVAVWLGELAEWVRPTQHLRVAAEEADNRIRECALAGEAEAIVTGDKGLLQLGRFESIGIVTLRGYLSQRKEQATSNRARGPD